MLADVLLVRVIRNSRVVQRYAFQRLRIRVENFRDYEIAWLNVSHWAVILHWCRHIRGHRFVSSENNFYIRIISAVIFRLETFTLLKIYQLFNMLKSTTRKVHVFWLSGNSEQNIGNLRPRLKSADAARWALRAARGHRLDRFSPTPGVDVSSPPAGCRRWTSDERWFSLSCCTRTDTRRCIWRAPWAMLCQRTPLPFHRKSHRWSHWRVRCRAEYVPSARPGRDRTRACTRASSAPAPPSFPIGLAGECSGRCLGSAASPSALRLGSLSDVAKWSESARLGRPRPRAPVALRTEVRLSCSYTPCGSRRRGSLPALVPGPRSDRGSCSRSARAKWSLWFLVRPTLSPRLRSTRSAASALGLGWMERCNRCTCCRIPA